MVNMLEIFFEQIFDFGGVDDPGSDWFFGLLFFLDDYFWGIDFGLLENFARFDSVVDFGLDFFLFFEILLDIDEGVVSELFIVFDFGDLFNLA